MRAPWLLVLLVAAACVADAATLRSAVSAAECSVTNSTGLPCCGGLQCPFARGVCCSGAQSCCPEGAQCTSDSPPRCHARVLVTPTAGGSTAAAQPAPTAPTVSPLPSASNSGDTEGERINRAVAPVGDWVNDFQKKIYASRDTVGAGIIPPSPSASSGGASGTKTSSAPNGKTVEEATRPLNRWMRNLRQRMIDDNNVARLTGSGRDSQLGVTPNIAGEEPFTYQSVMSQLRNAMAGDGMIKTCQCPPAPPCCQPAPSIPPPPRPSCCAPLAPCQCSPSDSSKMKVYPNGCKCPEQETDAMCACELMATAAPEQMGTGSDKDLIKDIEPPVTGAAAGTSTTQSQQQQQQQQQGAPSLPMIPTPVADAVAVANAVAAQVAAANASAGAVSNSSVVQALAAPGAVNFSVFDAPENAPDAEPFALQSSVAQSASVSAGSSNSTSPVVANGTDANATAAAAAAAAATAAAAAATPVRSDADDDKADDGSAPLASGTSDGASSAFAPAAGGAGAAQQPQQGIVVNVVVQPPEESGSLDLSSGPTQSNNEADAREAQFDAKAQQAQEAKAREADQVSRKNQARVQYCIGRTAQGELRMIVRQGASDGSCDASFDALGTPKGTFAPYANFWGYSEQVEGTSPLCFRSAASSAWRSEAVWGSSCNGGDWRQDYVAYVMRGGRPKAVPFCVKASVDPNRVVRQYIEVGRTQCSSEYWRQLYVFWAYQTREAAGVADNSTASGTALAAADTSSAAGGAPLPSVPSTVTPVVKSSFREARFREVHAAAERGAVLRDSTWSEHRPSEPAAELMDPAVLQRQRRLKKALEFREMTGGVI